MKTMHAWYSRACHQAYPAHRYRTPKGREVLITVMSEIKECPSTFGDERYVGLIIPPGPGGWLGNVPPLDPLKALLTPRQIGS